MSKTPYRKIARELGYNQDQKGIINRYFREEGGWYSHIRNTKEFILDLINSNKIGSVAVLGSGWLLDVPLEELADKCKRVYLVDITHPKQVQHKCNKYANVKLITDDINGSLSNQLYSYRKSTEELEYERLINNLEIVPYRPEFECDYIISLNILNQLDILVVDYILKKVSWSADNVICLRKKIQNNHICSLKSMRGALITDFEEEVYTMNGELQRKSPLIYIDLPDGIRKQYWKWEFDLVGEYYPEMKTILNVVGIEL